MTFDIFAIQAGEAVLFGLLGLAISLILSFVFLRLYLGQKLGEIFHEIVVDNNNGVGSLFSYTSLIVSLFVGFALSAGFSTPTDDSLAGYLWFVMGGSISLVVAYMIFHVVVRWAKSSLHADESVIGFVRREIRDDNSAAIVSLFYGIVFSIAIPMLLQII